MYKIKSLFVICACAYVCAGVSVSDCANFQSSSKKATRALVDPDFSLFNVEYFVSPARICSALIISKAH